jgi:hypothetical protein
LPRGSAYRISGGYVVPRASHRAVTGSACLGRERLMEQPVSSGNISSCETETHATFRSHEHMLGDIKADRGNLRHGSDPLRFLDLPILARPTLVEDAIHDIRFT